MKLTQISARNFKGLTFTTDLSDTNILIGENFAGKTARADAIRLLLLGYLPELGKAQRAAFDLSSGTEMEVTGTFDNGQRIRRLFRVKGNSVTCENEIPPEIEKCGQLAVMLNAEEYFSLSDRARVEYVFNNGPVGGGWTKKAVLERMIEFLKTKCEGKDWATGIIAPIVQVEKGTADVQQFIEQAIEKCAELYKGSRAYASRMEQTIQGLSALRAGDSPEQIVTSLASLDEKLVMARDALNAAQERRAAAAHERDAQIKAARRAGDITAQITAAKHHKEHLESFTNQLNIVRSKKEAITSEIPDNAVITQMQTEMAKLNGEHGAKKRDLQNERAEQALIHKEKVEMNSKDRCPYCGASGDGWKEIKKLELEQRAEKSAEREKVLTDELLDIFKQIQAISEKLNRIEFHRRARNELNLEENRLLSQINAAEAMVVKITVLEDELKNLPAIDANITAKAEQAETDVQTAMRDLNNIEVSRKAAIGRQHDLKRLADAEKDRDKAREEEEMAKIAGTELRRLQGEMVEAAFGPLLTRGNRFFEGILKTPLSYKDGEIGTRRDGVWVGHRTFSGVEKALTYAAIQASLAMNSPVRIMVLDELGRMTEQNLIRAIELAHDAIRRGELDQFIGIDARHTHAGYLPLLTEQLSSLNVIKI